MDLSKQFFTKKAVNAVPRSSLCRESLMKTRATYEDKGYIKERTFYSQLCAMLNWDIWETVTLDRETFHSNHFCWPLHWWFWASWLDWITAAISKLYLLFTLKVCRCYFAGRRLRDLPLHWLCKWHIFPHTRNNDSETALLFTCAQFVSYTERHVHNVSSEISSQ